MPRRAKQDELGISGPGVSPVVHKDIDRLADQLHDVLEEKSELATEVTKLTGKIVEKMNEYQITKYKFRDQEVIIEGGKVKVKLKTVKSENPESDGEAEEPPLGE